MQIEVWKNIKGYQGKYQVSNLGRVKSLNYNKTNEEKIMIGHKVGKGYKRVLLSKNGKSIKFSIHRLVYETFNGVIPQGYQIDHIDNNPQNNRLQNLQCLTASENSKKRFSDNKNLQCGTPKTKIKCIETKELFQSQNQAARRLNLSCGNINNVLKGRYKQTGGYSFKYIDDNTEDKIVVE